MSYSSVGILSAMSAVGFLGFLIVLIPSLVIGLYSAYDTHANVLFRQLLLLIALLFLLRQIYVRPPNLLSHVNEKSLTISGFKFVNS